MKKVIMVCNAHLDPVWLWQWQEGAAEALSTFRVAADFCREYDGFVFCHNEALLYEWVEEYDPQLFARIQELAKAGKWRIMGGWYLQPDCVMISGESFVRQIQYGRKYFWEKFASVPSTAINFDSFGHSVGMVQVLRKAGYTSYVVCRAGRAQQLEGSDFCWEGLDKSRITVHFSDENYNSVKGKAAEELKTWLDRHAQEETGLFLWGVGNHGGGPSREDIRRLEAFYQEHADCVFLASGPETYFAEKNFGVLPQYSASLGPVAEGCYTSLIRIKQKHRKLENELYMCEKMMSQAAMENLCDYPVGAMMEIQKALMFAQFHDALPGSAIKAVEEDTIRCLDYGLELAAKWKAKAFFALCAGQERVKDGQTPILVYNPHPFAADMVVDCEVVLPKQNWEDDYMVPQVYQGGHRLPCQVEKESSSFEIDWKKRCVFLAHLEPASMNRFDVSFVREKQKPPVRTVPMEDKIRFDNGRLQAVLDCKTGLLESLCVDNKPYLKPGALCPVVMHDFYNSWGVGYRDFDDVDGVFTLASKEEGSRYSALEDGQTPSVRIIEEGSVRMVTESIFCYGHSFLRMRLHFPGEGTCLGVELQLLWQEKDRMLKLSVPTCLGDAVYMGQTAFGRERLAYDGTEAVSHKWSALLSREGEAVCCINDGVYGSNCKDGEMRITLVRSAGYGMADCNGKKALKPGIMIDRMDQGERNYRFWLDFGNSREVMEGIDNRALLYNEMPMALSYCPSGEGEKHAPAMRIHAPNVVLSSMKKAEDTEGYVLRLYEAQGLFTELELELPGLGVKTVCQIAPYEIKTFLADVQNAALREIPLLEKEYAETQRQG